MIKPTKPVSFSKKDYQPGVVVYRLEKENHCLKCMFLQTALSLKETEETKNYFMRL